MTLETVRALLLLLLLLLFFTPCYEVSFHEPGSNLVPEANYIVACGKYIRN
jgi:hypothetical protein